MQFPALAKPPAGIVFDSAMDRIDEALALALLYGFDGKEQARVAAIAVSRPDLAAARFCDAVRMFYLNAAAGAFAGFRGGLPIGLADGKASAGVPMLNVALAQKSAIHSEIDTADPATLIRNALMAYHDQNAAVVLSGPATDLAKLLAMPGVKDLIARKVRLLCATEPGLEIDAPAARAVLGSWPSPIATVSRELGESLPFPGESIEKDFAWATAHPVVEAFRAYKPAPYDPPSWAMAAILHAVRPKENYFTLSGGKLVLDPTQKQRVLQAYVELASARPVPRKPRHAPDDKDKKADEKKKEPAK